MVLIGYANQAMTEGKSDLVETRLTGLAAVALYMYNLLCQTIYTLPYVTHFYDVNLWTYITLQINFHNQFLRDIFQAITSPEQAHVRRCFPEQLEEYVYPTEVNDDVCIIAKAKR